MAEQHEAREMTPQEAYEEDRRRRGMYDNGKPRPAWENLPEIAKWSWRRNPTPRNWSPVPEVQR